VEKKFEDTKGVNRFGLGYGV